MTGPRQHQRVRADSRTGLKGVGWHEAAGAWRATITRPDGRRLHLGLHSTPEAAALAYDRAALDLYGPGAWTNAGNTLTNAARHELAGHLTPDGVRDESGRELTPNPDGVRHDLDHLDEGTTP